MFCASSHHVSILPVLPIGAPDIASSSGQFAPGHATTSLGNLRRSNTVEMLKQSSKYDEGRDEEQATQVSITPRKTPPSKPSIDLVDSPDTLDQRSAPRSRNTRPDVKRQLFPHLRRPTPKKKVNTPKPEGYWKLLILSSESSWCSCNVCKLSSFELRVRRHFKPNSKGEVHCTPHVLEMGKTVEGRALLALQHLYSLHYFPTC